MTENEIKLLCSQLEKSSSYFEYGAGESTKLAADRGNITRIASVESDGKFIDDSVRTHQAVSEREDAGSLKFLSVNIGPTGRWGRPMDNTEKALWPNYPKAITDEGGIWELVLVDGLFRVSCVAAAFSHSPDTKVFVHDFWRRKRYRPVLQLCDVIETADQLVLLGRKPGASDLDFETMLRKHQFFPADKTPWLTLQSKVGIKV